MLSCILTITLDVSNKLFLIFFFLFSLFRVFCLSLSVFCVCVCVCVSYHMCGMKVNGCTWEEVSLTFIRALLLLISLNGAFVLAGCRLGNSHLLFFLSLFCLSLRIFPFYCFTLSLSLSLCFLSRSPSCFYQQCTSMSPCL